MTLLEQFKHWYSDYPDRPLWRVVLDPHDLRESGYMDHWEFGTIEETPYGDQLWRNLFYRWGWRISERRSRK